MTTLAAGTDALGGAVTRLTDLLRSGIDPSARVTAKWDVGDAAAHLSHAFRMMPLLANGTSGALGADLVEIGTLTGMLVEGETERDLAVLATRIEEGYAQLVADAAGATGDEARTWVVTGTTCPQSMFFPHLLNETLVHGHDIATACGRPWPISRPEAAMVLTDFIVPIIRMMDPKTLVIEEKAGRLRACYDLRLRGSRSVHLVFRDGDLAAEEPSRDRPVDVHISADPVAFLLVLWDRQSQWKPISRGKMTAWGRKPWLAFALRSYLRNP